MKWHELTRDGCLKLDSEVETKDRSQLADDAIDQLLLEIADACRGSAKYLLRATQLRSRVPSEFAEKGYLTRCYQALNQLVHYSYYLLGAPTASGRSFGNPDHPMCPRFDAEFRCCGPSRLGHKGEVSLEPRFSTPVGKLLDPLGLSGKA